MKYPTTRKRYQVGEFVVISQNVIGAITAVEPYSDPDEGYVDGQILSMKSFDRGGRVFPGDVHLRTDEIIGPLDLELKDVKRSRLKRDYL